MFLIAYSGTSHPLVVVHIRQHDVKFIDLSIGLKESNIPGYRKHQDYQ